MAGTLIREEVRKSVHDLTFQPCRLHNRASEPPHMQVQKTSPRQREQGKSSMLITVSLETARAMQQAGFREECTLWWVYRNGEWRFKP